MPGAPFTGADTLELASVACAARGDRHSHLRPPPG